jgi:hypothetical protein
VAASPKPDIVELMNERYATYRRLYPALQYISGKSREQRAEGKELGREKPYV